MKRFLYSIAALVLSYAGANAAYYAYGSIGGEELTFHELEEVTEGYVLRNAEMVAYTDAVEGVEGAAYLLFTDGTDMNSYTLGIWGPKNGESVGVMLEEGNTYSLTRKSVFMYNALAVAPGSYDILFNPNDLTVTLYADGTFEGQAIDKSILYVAGTIDGGTFEALKFYAMEEIPAGSGVWYLDGVNMTANQGEAPTVFFTFDSSKAGQSYIGNIAGYGALSYAAQEPIYATEDNPEAVNEMAYYNNGIIEFTPSVGTYDLVVDINNNWVRFVGEGSNQGSKEDPVQGDDEGDMFVYYSNGQESYYRRAMTEDTEGIYSINSVEVENYYSLWSEYTGGIVEFSAVKITDFDIVDSSWGNIFYGAPSTLIDTGVVYGAEGNPCIMGDYLVNPYNVNAGTYDITLDTVNMKAYFTEPGTVGIKSIAADAKADGWYTIQGIRVATPQAGNIYIRVNGGKAEKVAF
ncbi:MAG: hypothetical protein LUD17_07735 [Bacteroidales bacterium]|nr:hypothetical protein [Bacteroidales bacterium]